MKSLKTLLVLLLVWTFSVQAIASASGVNCRHAGRTTASAADEASHAGHRMPSQMADPHAMHHGGHAGHSAADQATKGTATGASVASWQGCGCGCTCASSHCANPCSSITGIPALAGFADFGALSLQPTGEQTSLAGAHDHDLIRPPSIS